MEEKHPMKERNATKERKFIEEKNAMEERHPMEERNATKERKFMEEKNATKEKRPIEEKHTIEDTKLGAVESRFADIIWQQEPLSSGELVKLCGEELGWKKSTTYTVLKKISMPPRAGSSWRTHSRAPCLRSLRLSPPRNACPGKKSGRYAA